MHPDRELIRGVVCGVRVEEVEDPLMRNIRYLDKLIDELAIGKSMDRMLRQWPAWRNIPHLSARSRIEAAESGSLRRPARHDGDDDG
ncbi:MAG: DUF2200 family protein [Wenzhouxiangellaceae bacterium]|nr:DUF2200 family protein [Wenzhouxiangellaceae bacterium]